jgi:hypothetical protein
MQKIFPHYDARIWLGFSLKDQVRALDVQEVFGFWSWLTWASLGAQNVHFGVNIWHISCEISLDSQGDEKSNGNSVTTFLPSIAFLGAQECPLWGQFLTYGMWHISGFARGREIEWKWSCNLLTHPKASRMSDFINLLTHEFNFDANSGAIENGHAVCKPPCFSSILLWPLFRAKIRYFPIQIFHFQI